MMYSKKNLDWLVPAFFGWNWLIEQIGVVPAVKGGVLLLRPWKFSKSPEMFFIMASTVGVMIRVGVMIIFTKQKLKKKTTVGVMIIS